LRQGTQSLELFGIGRESLICFPRLSCLYHLSRLFCLPGRMSCRLPMRERGFNARPGNAERASTIREQSQKTSAKPISVAMDRMLKEKEPSSERNEVLLRRSPRRPREHGASIAAEKP